MFEGRPNMPLLVECDHQSPNDAPGGALTVPLPNLGRVARWYDYPPNDDEHIALDSGLQLPPASFHIVSSLCRPNRRPLGVELDLESSSPRKRRVDVDLLGPIGAR